MSKVFRPWKTDVVWLLAPSVADFVPAGHPAHLIRDLVSEDLDLSAIMGAYTEVKGYPPYHPAMMVAPLLCSEANLEGLIARTVRGYVAAGRASKPGGGKPGGPKVQAMRARLRQGGYRSRYRMRKYVVEPVFGHSKQARGFRQFLLRGIDTVRGEWAMICIDHNLAKLTA
jgi:hypothetical protein